MKILVLGAGALGGYFGGWLAQNGADVTFLVRPARKALLAEKGLRIESPLGALSLAVRTVTSDEIAAPADIVLLTAKAYDLDSAIEAISPAVGPHTGVLPILNGMNHIERLIAEFGAARVIGGLAKIPATLAADGTIMHLGALNEIIFGELDGRLSDRVVALQALFPEPHVKARAVADIKRQLWLKLMQLGTIAAVTTLTRNALGVISQATDGPWLIESTLRTAAEIVRAEGYAVSDEMFQSHLKAFTAAGSIGKASMLRDMEKGGPTEGAHILGYLAGKAVQHGIANPIFRVAAANVATYEVGRRGA